MLTSTTKWKYLTSTQTLGQPKRLFHFARNSEFLNYLNIFFYFSSFRISDYAVVSRESSVLIIGGKCDYQGTARIAKYTLDNWEHVGNLQRHREGHGAISNGDRIYVVGGYAGEPLSTEIWSLDENDNTNVKVAEPKLPRYEWYPALFLVPSDYCSKN